MLGRRVASVTRSSDRRGNRGPRRLGSTDLATTMVDAPTPAVIGRRRCVRRVHADPTADAACDSLSERISHADLQGDLNSQSLLASGRRSTTTSGSAVRRFYDGFNSSERFYVGVADDDASFGLGSVQGQPAFVEQLSPTAYLAIGGSASASLLFAGLVVRRFAWMGTVRILRHDIAGGCASARLLGRLRVRPGPDSRSMRVEQASAAMGAADIEYASLYSRFLG